MKGILIEKAGRNSVVMANDGKFMKVSGRKGWNTGDEVEFPSAGARAAKAASIAAMFVIVMALSLFGVYAANSYTVNLDVNPSIEIEVNAFNNVTEITALNDDAEQIGDLQSLVGMKLGPAVNQAILMLVEEGYLDVDGTVVLSVEGSNNKVKTVTREVSESVADARIESEQTNAGGNGKLGEDGMNIYIGRITPEIVEAAEQYDIPYGRALLVSKAMEEGSDIDYDAAVVLSVREIQRIRNISKTMEKIAESEEKGNQNSTGQSNQTQALTNKLYSEAAKIEDYLSELAVLIESGEADEEVLAEYAELYDRLENIYLRIEAAGMGTYEEIMSTVMTMTKNKGEDVQLKNNVKTKVENALSNGEQGKPEDTPGKGNDKGNSDENGQNPVDNGQNPGQSGQNPTDNGQGSSDNGQGSDNSGNGNSQGGGGKN